MPQYEKCNSWEPVEGRYYYLMRTKEFPVVDPNSEKAPMKMSTFSEINNFAVVKLLHRFEE